MGDAEGPDGNAELVGGRGCVARRPVHLVRVVEEVARRPQVQERMTQQIAEFLDETLHPQGVAVVAEGLHMCAAMRGVKKANARMSTSAMLGLFKEDQNIRQEFFSHVERRPVNF